LFKSYIISLFLVLFLSCSLCAQSNIQGVSNACLGDTCLYSVEFESDCKYLWRVAGGEILGDANVNAIKVLWNTPGAGNIVLKKSKTNPSKADSLFFSTIVADKAKLILNGNQYVCEHQAFEYSFQGANAIKSIQWQAANGLILGSSKSDTVRIQWGDAGFGELDLVVHNLNDCVDTLNYMIIINPESKPNILGNSKVCISELERYKAEAHPNCRYFWSVKGGILETDSIGSEIMIRWTDESDLSVVMTERNEFSGCEKTATKVISAYHIPKVELTPLPDLCSSVHEYVLSGGTPSGGYYSGFWVSSNIFYPSSAGVGEHLISYNLPNSAGCVGIATTTINVRPMPNKPTAKYQSGRILSSESEGNQWYLNGEKIAGEVKYYIIPSKEGEYQVKTINYYSCESELSDPYIYKLTSNVDSPEKQTMSIVDDIFFYRNAKSIISYDLFSLSGSKITSKNLIASNELAIPLTNLSAGIYIINFRLEDGECLTKHFVKR
jgi:hypothetical protein